MNKKESRKINISVEGINCEKMYFKYLAILINTSNKNVYNLKIDPKKMNPMEYAKRNAFKHADQRRGNRKIPYIHIQDIEDYYDDYQRKKFHELIDSMRMAEKQLGITSEPGYSNYTFELWMLLHVADMKHVVQDRHSYLAPINRRFHRNYKDIDEFKNHNEFQKILNEFVTLDSISLAINRAEKIVAGNSSSRKIRETYKGFSYYRDNPDLSVHKIVRMILDICQVKL